MQKDIFTSSSSQAWWAGLTNPQETTKTEDDYSTRITIKLTDKMYHQKLDLDYNPS